MAIDPSHLDVLWSEGDVSLSRGVLDAAGAQVLVAAGPLARLEHELALRGIVEAAWAACPQALVSNGAGPRLILADPGGESLARLVGKPWETAAFLRAALGLFIALDRVHDRGLTHKDVRPANILLDARAGTVWLTGFGIASRALRERQNVSAVLPSGTLAYVAPEQTGRTNRSVDARSDLYSCGVTLYEMLTGILPFRASDPAELLHAHLAREPIPPCDVSATIPAPLSAVVMKLLAKAPEDRYQSARGVLTDLRRCLADWERFGHVERFTLGADDISRRLRVPEKLYGREREVQELLEAFARTGETGTKQLVLVTGYPGIGKSSLINELRRVLLPARALFASGKADDTTRDTPYSPFAHALRMSIRVILAQPENEVARWRESFVRALGSSGRLIVDLVPELAHVVGELPALAEVSPEEAHPRFLATFVRFLGVLATADHPLVLVLDDLQWADEATLALLEHVAAEEELHHLFIVGAYRSSEVGPEHRLSTLRAQSTISLSPLSVDDFEKMLAVALVCDREHVRPLARLVYEKTSGNPFFATQFVSALYDASLITFDAATASWRWDVTSIQAQNFTDNVVELMLARFGALSPDTRDAMTDLACLGSTATTRSLEIAASEKVHGSLAEAIRAGLVFQVDGAYAFLHDRVREASYALLDEPARAAKHHRIAQQLLAATPVARREEGIFDIVNQYNVAVALVVTPDERALLAELNVLAGRRAKASSAHALAHKYLSHARALLPTPSFEVELLLAECERLSGANEAAEARLLALEPHVKCPVDRAALVCQQTHLYTTTDRFDRVVPLCLDYLRQVSIELSPSPTDDEVRTRYDEMRARIGARSIEALFDLPRMTDPRRRATIDVLSLFTTPAYFANRNLYALLIVHIVLLSLEHGNTDGSALAFSLLGTVIGPRFSAYRDGHRFGRLSVRLVDERGLDRYAPRVHMVFATNVIPWTIHLRASHEVTHRAGATALQGGDLTYASYCAGFAVTYRLAAGARLDDVLAEAESALGVARRAGHSFAVDLVTGQLDLIHALRAPLAAEAAPTSFDEGRLARAENTANAVIAVFYWIRRLQTFFHLERWEEAVATAAKARALLDFAALFYEEAEFHLYSALAHARAFDAAPGEEQPALIAIVEKHHAQLTTWAEDCAATFAGQAAMVGAELARIRQSPLEAERLYEDAIQSARREGFVHFAAIANELAGRFWQSRGFATIAEAYSRAALAGYEQWGARRKQDLLESRRAGSGPTGPSSEMLTARLDAAAVVRASQAISGEIVLDSLVAVLLQTALESAGATRAVLVTVKDGVPEVASVVHAVPRNEHERTVPESIVRYVLRTRENVLIDDVSDAHPFANDIGGTRARSLLALPIAAKAKPMGVLLLENELAVRAFPADRISLLSMLAAQAAISLENARLYSEVHRARTQLTRIVDSIPALAWTAGPDGSGRFFNRQWLDYTGLSLEEAQGRTHPTAIHPDEAGSARLSWQRLVQSGESGSFEARLRASNGTYRWFLTRAQPLYDKGGVAEWYGTSTDIEDRKQAEIELDSRVRFWTLRSAIAARLTGSATDRLDAEIDAALAQMGAFFDADSIFIFWFAKTGHEAVATHTWAKYGIALPPNTVTFFPDSVDELRRGLDVPVSDVARMPDHKHMERDALQSMGLKSVVAIPLVIGGQTIASMNLATSSRYLEWTDEILQRLRILGEVFAHALARRRAELDLERSESALHRAHTELAHVTRITTLGELAASIAHEINQPLAAIIAEAAAATNWLDAPVPKLSNVRESLTAVGIEAERAGEILRRIRALLSRSAIETSSCDLDAVVHAVLPVVRRQLLQAEVVLETSLHESLPGVIGDPVQLQQVVLNLILNATDSAREVHPSRRRIVVRTVVVQRDEGPNVVVEVEDSGVGLGSDDITRLFEPFFTTKTHGLGMGLAISRSIIERHGGRLWGRPSESGQGATFGFSLAAVESSSQGALA